MTRDVGVTLITGATKGIGRAISDRLIARGERVVGIARSADPSYQAPLILADLGDRRARAEALKKAAAEYRILRLVNNAGLNRMQALGEITTEAADEVLDLNPSTQAPGDLPRGQGHNGITAAEGLEARQAEPAAFVLGPEAADVQGAGQRVQRAERRRPVAGA